MSVTSVSQLQGNSNFEDQISQLPDEILISILSSLPIKEAGRTSVLSGRWRNSWKLTSCLNFDKSGVLDLPSSISPNELDLWRSRYVTWVNEVLRLHQCHHLDEFRIHFDLDAKSSSHLDEWMKFMIQKRATRIEIHLTPSLTRYPYTPSLECYQHIKSPSNLSNLMCLRSLTLIHVNVAGEFVEYLLSKCPHLETLSISCSKDLRVLRVDGPSLPLKYLKTDKCISLKLIVLSAPNLETFEYSGKRVEYIIGNLPLLSELHLLDGRRYHGGFWPVTSSLLLFPGCFSQLETLSLNMAFEYGLDMPQAGELRNLKHLMLETIDMHDSWILDFPRFLVAAPSLVKLKVQFTRWVEKDYLMEEPLIQSHECLKEVEIRWRSGGFRHFKFAMYLAKTTVNLEQMVLDMPSPERPVMDRFVEEVRPRIIQNAVDRVEETLPRGAKLTAVGTGFNFLYPPVHFSSRNYLSS